MPSTVFVLLIIAMGLTVPLYAMYLKSRRHRHSASEREEQLERELAELRDRVETLERIVTDRRYDLDKEFEDLDRPSRSG